MKKPNQRKGKKAVPKKPRSKKARDGFDWELEKLLKETDEDGWHDVEFDIFEDDDCPLCVELGLESQSKTRH